MEGKEACEASSVDFLYTFYPPGLEMAQGIAQVIDFQRKMYFGMDIAL
jgi:hypothetical protein